MSNKTIDITTLSGYSSLPDGTYTITARASATGKATSDPSTGVSYTKSSLYSISVSTTNVSANPGNPTTIEVGGNATLTFTANTGYVLPDSVTVSGATSNWTKSTGTLVLSNPTGNVSISISGALLQKHNLYMDLDGGYFSGPIYGETSHGGSYTFNGTFSKSGRVLSPGIIVDGEEYYYQGTIPNLCEFTFDLVNDSTATISFTNVLGDVEFMIIWEEEPF